MKKQKIPVVVIRSNDNCFLDVLRCCGIADIPVIPVIFTWEGAGPWFSEKSIYYTNPVHIENPAKNESVAVAQLLELGAKLQYKYQKKALVIPTSDTSLTFLQRHFKKFSMHFLLMGHEDFDISCMDVLLKDKFAAKMVENGISIPQTMSCTAKSDIDYVLEHLSFPCLYKPTIKDISNSFMNSHDRRKAIECKSVVELRDGLAKEIVAGYELIVQEKIEFEKPEHEISCYIYINKTQVVTAISGQYKLGEYPKPYGTGYLSKFETNKDLSLISAKVAKALKWRGFLGVEFMKDKKDKKWKVIEANLRPWLSVFFQATAGYNYIKMLYEDAYGLNTEQKNNQQHKGPENDLYRVNLKILIQKIYDSTDSIDQFTEQLADWFRQHQGRYVFTMYHPTDPLPAVYELEQLAKQYPVEYQNVLLTFAALFKNQP